MDVGIELIGLLLVVWLVGDVAIVAVAVCGAGARARRAARMDITHVRRRSPRATLRLGAAGRRSPHRRLRRRRARTR